jgi:methyl-accepting chemotaxis protein
MEFKRLSEMTVSEMGVTSTIMVISVACALLLGLLIAVWISKAISKPLNRIGMLAAQAKTGDLTAKRSDYNYTGRDELGRLADSLDDMVQTQAQSLRGMKEVFSKVSSEAETLAALSEETSASMGEIKTSVDQMASLSESNTSSLETSNASVSEMAAAANTTAQSATTGAEFIAQTSDMTGNSVRRVNASIDDLKNVEIKSRENETLIRTLVQSVEQITSFVSIITSIAVQTNLLALNAAIEAARAGDAGRGFAVVAEEVRKLAEESGRAAKNINDLISTLQEDAGKAINGTSAMAQTLRETLEKAEGARDQLNQALGGMEKANESIQSIAAVAEEQAASSREMASGIDVVTRSTVELGQRVEAIRGATQETVTASEGVALSAQKMTELALEAQGQLNRFTLNADGDREANAALAASSDKA